MILCIAAKDGLGPFWMPILKDIFWLNIIALGILIIGGGRAHGATTLGSVYAEQPVWWNDVTLVRPTGKVDRAEAYWAWLQASNPPAGRLLDNWHVIGPFDGEKGVALDKPYPPENSIERTTVPGVGPLKVSWQPWAPGTTCPLTNRIPDTIAYATRKITVNAPFTGGFTISSGAGYRLWVDGRPVVTNGVANPYGLYVPVRLDTGAHSVLVKAYLPDGNWSWNTTWCAVDPRYTEIKSRSLVVSLWPGDETVLRGHAPRLAALYLGLEDTVNGRYWAGITLAACRTNAAELSAAIGSWFSIVCKSAVTGPVLNRELGEFLGHLPKADPLRPILSEPIFNLGLALSRPDETAQLLRAAGVRPTPTQAFYMMQVCLASNLMENASFWADPYLQDFQNGPSGYNEYYRGTVNDWLQRSPYPFRVALYESIDNAFMLGTNAELRAILADCYMKDVLTRKDTGRASQFLKAHTVMLELNRSFEAAIWRLQLAVLENNEVAARKALDSAVLARPAFTNSAEYSYYRASVFKFNVAAAMPASVELAPDEAPMSADRLAKAGNTSRLGVYLRDVLRSCGDSTVPVEGDPNLYTGAKPYYRKSLAAYAPAYEAWLRHEINILAAEPAREEDARRLDRIAHFEPTFTVTGGNVPSGSEVAAGTPVSITGYVPLLDMTPGLPEVIEDQLHYLVKADPALAASLSVRGGDAWLANSRMLTCLRGGAVVWSWAAPLPNPLQQGSLYPSFRMGGRYEPAAVGDIVATRILLPDATPAVVGLDRKTGTHQWTWRPDKSIPAGAPTPWGTNHLAFLTMAEDAMSGYRTALVVLDTHGVEQAKVQLGGRRIGDPTHGIGDRGISADRFLQAPAPVVDGDIAYVSTALGLVGAVNLADESIVWLRKYNHDCDASVTGFRVPRPPVVGRNTILFAPQDSNQLMLLDKATGRLVASRTDLVWTEVAPCGSESAVVLTRSTAYVLNLADLGERRLPAGRVFSVVQPVREGCMLAERNGAVALCSPDGKLTAMAPASDEVRLLGRGPDGICYGAGGPGGQWCVAVGNGAIPAPRFIRPQHDVASLCDMSQGVLASTNGAVPLVANSLVLLGMGNDGRRLWELPALPLNGVISEKGHVVMARAGRAWVYDEQTADLLGTWPAGFGLTGLVQRVFSAPEGGSYALGSDADQRMTLWSLDTGGSPTGRKVAQWAPNVMGGTLNAAMIQTATQGVVVIRHDNGYTTLWTAPRGQTNAVFERKNDKKMYGSLWNSGLDWPSRTTRFTAAAVAQTQDLIRVDSAGLREIQPILAPGKTHGTIYTEDELLLLVRDDRTMVAMNPATGFIWDLTKENVSAPVVVGSRIYGVKATMTGEVAAAKVANYRPYTYAMDGHSEPVLGPPLPVEFGVNCWLAAVVQSGGMSTVIVPGGALPWKGSVVQEPRRLPPIPDFGWNMPLYVWSTPQGVVNVGGVWMSPSLWQTVLQLSNTVHSGVVTSRVVNVDGFLDEWPANEFFNIPLGRMAASVNSAAELLLAVEIQDATMVERLGVGGLEDRLTMTAVRSINLPFR